MADSYVDIHGIDDYKDIITLAIQGQMYWEPSKRMMTKGKRWYDQDVPIVTPRRVESHVPSTAPTLVNDAADHLAGNDPDFQVQERRETGKALDDRARVQKALNATFGLIGSEYGHALHRTIAIHGGWSGMMAARVGVHDGWDPENPKITDIYWQPVDPRYVYPDPGSLGKKYVIIRFQRNVGLIRQAWPDWQGHWFPSTGQLNALGGYGTHDNGIEHREHLKNPLPDTTVVDWIEYWDEKYKCYIANGVPVFRQEYGVDFLEHGLGINPFIIRAAGYGDDTGEAHERFRSMLSYVFHWLDLEARLITQYKWIVEDTAWPTWLAPEDMRGLNVHPGTINYVPNPESIKAFRAVREDSVKPEAVVQLLTYVKDEIERATYPVILKGQAPSGIRAGYPIAILSTQARLKFAAPTDALKNIFQELAYKTLAIVKNRFATNTEVIDDLDLKPDDFDKYMGRIKIALDPQLPTDFAALLPKLTFLIGSLGYSKALAMRDLGVTNPEEVRELRMAEDMEDDPRTKQLMGEYLLQFLMPEAASAAQQVLQPNIEMQQLQQTVQQMQGMMQYIMMAQQMQQAGMQPPPLPAGMGQPGQQGPPQIPLPQGPPPGVPPVPVQPGGITRGQTPGNLAGQPGGTQFGQNLASPNQGGQSFATINPETVLRGVAANLRAGRTLEEYKTQENAYGI